MVRRMCQTILIVFALLRPLSLISYALTLSGDLDPALGGTGTVITNLVNSFDSANAVQYQITSLPMSGTLKLGVNSVTFNQEIPIGQLGSLTYVSDLYFPGSDAFNWNGFDSINYAATDATVTLNVTFANQPPAFTTGAKVSVLENSAV